MSSSRAIFCESFIFVQTFIILLFSLNFILADISKSPPTEDAAKGNCSCGGFPTTTPEVGSAPILSQTPGLVVACNEEGGSTCKQLCNALALATKAKGPEILCNMLKDANELKLSAFYKVCDEPWQYADMTAEETLCCEDNKVKTCPSNKSDGDSI